MSAEADNPGAAGSGADDAADGADDAGGVAGVVLHGNVLLDSVVARERVIRH
ncbi:hypothetical protein HKD39_18135, partial [Nakamurella sp. DB0629]|nr:hypothetical protein [Nakamurella aerolata]